jgi:hypothetical protein
MVRFSFEEGLETPMKAIPFYLMIGMCLVPALQCNGERIVRAADAGLLLMGGAR